MNIAIATTQVGSVVAVMPNRNYVAGVRLERDVMEMYRKLGYSVARTAGSHGSYDVLAFDPQRPIELIQCKRCSTEAEKDKLYRDFKTKTIPSKFFHQALAIKIKGSKDIAVYTF